MLRRQKWQAKNSEPANNLEGMYLDQDKHNMTDNTGNNKYNG